MNAWCIEVGTKTSLGDAEGNRLAHDVADLGISTPVQVRTSSLYWIEGELDRSLAESLGKRLLADPIAQEFALNEDLHRPPTDHWIIEVRLKPGVTDTVGASVLKGARDVGLQGLRHVATGRKYYLIGELSESQARSLCERLLVNEVIHSYKLRHKP